MCSGALFWSGVRRVVYAAPAPVMAEVMGGDVLPLRCAQVFANASRAVEVDGPMLEDAAVEVLREAAARTTG
jgi:tRNA(Arg) A34 adenosine deaminase TadA